jgi:hypothetical protein
MVFNEALPCRNNKMQWVEAPTRVLLSGAHYKNVPFYTDLRTASASIGLSWSFSESKAYGHRQHLSTVSRDETLTGGDDCKIKTINMPLILLNLLFLHITNIWTNCKQIFTRNGIQNTCGYTHHTKDYYFFHAILYEWTYDGRNV